VLFSGRTALRLTGDFSHRNPVPLFYAKELAVKPEFTVDNPSDLHHVRTSTPAESRRVQYGGSAQFSGRPAPSTRYTREDKTMNNSGGVFATTGTVLSSFQYRDAATAAAWTPRFGLNLQLPHEALAYASATRGFNGGDFNLSAPSAGRGFAPDYTNLRVQTPIRPIVLDIANAAATTIRGLEVEGEAQPAPGWTVVIDDVSQSTVFFTPLNDRIQQQRSYSLVSANITIRPRPPRSVGVYARNVTDTDYITGTLGNLLPAIAGRPGEPRQVGVQLTLAMTTDRPRAWTEEQNVRR
jgi:outer membrane receptor protein involved in Fe transport